MIQLYDYQQKIIDDTRYEFQNGATGVLMRSPTGSGKTITTAKMLQSIYMNGKTAWFIVHRDELIKQSSLAFKSLGINHGIVCAGYQPNYRASIQICSIMSLKNRLKNLARPSVIVYDECQYMGAKTWDYIFEQNPNSLHIGLSATPWRLDGSGFTKYFQKMVHGPSVKWLIENKRLSDYKLYAPTNFDASQFSISKGDYDQAEVAEFMQKPTIVGDCFEQWAKYAYGTKTIVFAPSVEFSKSVVDLFNSKGIPSAHLDGTSNDIDRATAISNFSNGKIMLLSNCNLFVEGFDVPSATTLINCKPTRSLARYLQAVGRILRYVDGKKAIILDQVNSCVEHGLPCDDFEWQLEDRKKKRNVKSEKSESPVKVCSKCYAANNSVNKFCTNCGHKFDIKARTGPEQVTGDLEEIDKLEFKKNRKKEEQKAVTLEDLIKIGTERGYKNPAFWAKKKFNNGWRSKK